MLPRSEQASSCIQTDTNHFWWKQGVCESSRRSLLAFPEALILGSGNGRITANIKRTLTSAKGCSADSPPTGGQMADETHDPRRVTTEENNWTDDAFIGLSVGASGHKANWHSQKKKYPNQHVYISWRDKLFILTVLLISPCVPIVAKARRVLWGQGGAEELRKQRAHLRVGGLSEGQPGHHHLCY